MFVTVALIGVKYSPDKARNSTANVTIATALILVGNTTPICFWFPCLQGFIVVA